MTTAAVRRFEPLVTGQGYINQKKMEPRRILLESIRSNAEETMSPRQIAPDVFQVSAGGVNVFLIDADGVAMIDAGMPGKLDRIMGAVRAIGRSPTDVNDILITHYHLDHVGSLAELAEATRAKVHAPVGDCDIIRNGGRPPDRAHRGVAGLLLSRVITMSEQPPNPVDHEVEGGDEVAVAGGLRVIHSPGHTPGHVAFLYPRHGGVLFAGDAASNFLGILSVMPMCEDFDSADKSFAALADESFEIAGFGHGQPIRSGAAQRFKATAERLAH
jgi:glyoxylase-like metal-dependent hydrolase (beta-lactamase superfamily II)